MTTSCIRWLVAIAMGATAFSTQAAPPTQFYAYPVDKPDTATCHGNGINASGQIVGSCTVNDISRAVFTGPRGVGLTDLGILPGFPPLSSSDGLGINARGQVVGTSFSAAFITDDGGLNMRELALPEGSTGAATGINNLGQVAGWFLSTRDGIQSFLTAPGGANAVRLPSFGDSSSARGLNDRAEVVGDAWVPALSLYHAYATGPNGEGIRDLTPALVNAESQATAINERGDIAGSGTFDAVFKAFLVKANEVLPLTPLRKTSAFGNWISPSGALLGYAVRLIPRTSHATIGFDNQRNYDLNSYVANLPSFVYLTSAAGANVHGQIVADGSDGRIYIVCPTVACSSD